MTDITKRDDLENVGGARVTKKSLAEQKAYDDAAAEYDAEAMRLAEKQLNHMHILINRN